MLTELLNNPLSLVFTLGALIVAITVHEFAHALAADRLGDPTPRLMGRLTLNPLAHLDPIGTLMILIARFGWGKPVQFDPFNLRSPRRDAAIISLAGPASNILVAFISSVLLRLIIASPVLMIQGGFLTIVFGILSAFLTSVIILNIILAVFNLVPVHPLDGFKIVGGLLPERYAKQWYELQPYGIFFLILLILPLSSGGSPISRYISPVVNMLLSVFLPQTPLI